MLGFLGSSGELDMNNKGPPNSVPAGSDVSIPSKPGWALTFHDEFDSPKLEEGKWFTSYRWGRIAYSNARKTAGRPEEEEPAHYVIEDGVLHLRIDKDLPRRAEPAAPVVSSIQTSDYSYDPVTGRFAVQNKFAQKYGWFEIRCRMPGASGLHSAFWLLQTDPHGQEYTPEGVRKRPGDGVVEIDIFEMLGSEIAKRVNRFNVHLTRDGAYECPIPFDASKEFHVWALEWNEGELVWYLDGNKVRTYKAATPQKEMGVFLSLYQGAGWTGPVAGDMRYPRDFEVDYIRVYRRASDQ